MTGTPNTLDVEIYEGLIRIQHERIKALESQVEKLQKSADYWRNHAYWLEKQLEPTDRSSQTGE